MVDSWASSVKSRSTLDLLYVPDAGSVLDLDIMALDRQSEFVSVDKQSNDDVMHLESVWKSRSSCVPSA